MDAVMYDMMMISSIVLLTIFKSSNGVYIQKECEMESSFQQTTDCIIQQTRNFIDEASNNARQNQNDDLSEINVVLKRDICSLQTELLIAQFTCYVPQYNNCFDRNMAKFVNGLIQTLVNDCNGNVETYKMLKSDLLPTKSETTSIFATVWKSLLPANLNKRPTCSDEEFDSSLTKKLFCVNKYVRKLRLLASFESFPVNATIGDKHISMCSIIKDINASCLLSDLCFTEKEMNDIGTTMLLAYQTYIEGLLQIVNEFGTIEDAINQYAEKYAFVVREVYEENGVNETREKDNNLNMIGHITNLTNLQDEVIRVFDFLIKDYEEDNACNTLPIQTHPSEISPKWFTVPLIVLCVIFIFAILLHRRNSGNM